MSTASRSGARAAAHPVEMAHAAHPAFVQRGIEGMAGDLALYTEVAQAFVMGAAEMSRSLALLYLQPAEALQAHVLHETANTLQIVGASDAANSVRILERLLRQGMPIDTHNAAEAVQALVEEFAQSIARWLETSEAASQQ